MRWFATAWLLTIPFGMPKAIGPFLQFDRSLERLERNQVITPAERRELEGRAHGLRIESRRLRQGCRSGALSRQECASGVTVRGGRRQAARIAWRGRDGRPLPLVSVPVSALLGRGGFRLESVFSVTPRPAALAGNGNRRLLFPIIGSAITTSDFGWRVHPLFGKWLMHAGRDLAAPEGTPVVAALSGTVVSSGLAGGYGIAVELEHLSPRRRTLYGHLSEIYVKRGHKVRQGEVIGRVGSTGLSTGPHLHFELRRPQAGGWVAVDPGDMDLNPLTMQGGGDAVAMLMGQLLDSLRAPVPKRPAK